MTSHADLEAYVKGVFSKVWTSKPGTSVPADTSLLLGSNDAITIDATVLYADLAESTDLVGRYSQEFAAEIYKVYLHCAAKLIEHNGGVVTAYDGDRVMGVFLGNSKDTSAVRCAMNINYAILHIVNPGILQQYPGAIYVLKQKVGIDSSSLLVTRTGIRGTNDLVWVGTAANNAAKLAALPTNSTTYISEKVYNKLDIAVIMGGTPQVNMWTYVTAPQFTFPVIGSTWWSSF